MDTGFRAGARGFLVADLQRALGMAQCDGILGPATAAAIAARSAAHGLPARQVAGETLYKALGEPWPPLFERCLNLTANFEGAGFGGCNARDIDGAGITFGIAGFTSASGEVQALVRQFAAAMPGPLEGFTAARQEALASLLSRPGDTAAWSAFAYDSAGRLRADFRRTMAAWGGSPEGRRLQWDEARARFWSRALADAARLNIECDAGFGLMLDTAVQNGGWRHGHGQVYRRLGGHRAAPLALRLNAAARAVAECARPRWRLDVLRRKLVFALGRGRVHGLAWSLHAHALAPAALHDESI